MDFYVIAVTTVQATPEPNDDTICLFDAVMHLMEWGISFFSYTDNSSTSGPNGLKTASTSLGSTSSNLDGFHWGFCEECLLNLLLKQETTYTKY